MKSRLFLILLIATSMSASAQVGVISKPKHQSTLHSLEFTTWRGTPQRNVIFPQGHPRYGNPQYDQVKLVPLRFRANIYNSGQQDQHNVQLLVEIRDSSGSLISSLSSPIIPSLTSGDTAGYPLCTTTGSWTPSGISNTEYKAIFSIISDSIPSIGTSEKDSLVFQTHSGIHGSHFGEVHNSFGTSQGAIALAQAFTFTQDVTSPYHMSPQGTIPIRGMSIFVSGDSDTTGSIIIEVYDTAGFDLGSSGGPAGSPVFLKSFYSSSETVGKMVYIDFTTDGKDLLLSSKAGYYVVLNLMPQDPDGSISVGNDQTVRQPDKMLAMQKDNGVWMLPDTDSLSNLVLHFHVGGSHHDPGPVDFDETAKKKTAILIYPNPTASGKIYIEPVTAGTYTLELMNHSGKLLYSEQITNAADSRVIRNFSRFGKGIYLLHFKSDKFSTIKNLIIE